MSFTSILRASFRAALAFFLVATSVSAATFGKFTYDDNGSSVTITRYAGPADGTVVIPPTINERPVTAIGFAAFSCCTGLTGINIPNSVTSIGAQAFSSCDGLTSVNIPNSVTSIGDAAFDYCSGLTGFVVAPENPSYVSLNGVVFDKQIRTLVAYPGGKNGSYSIPGSVTSIRDRAFSGCTGLTGVTIPNSVTSIGHYTFSGCTGLTGITIPNSVTSIGHYTFTGCTRLTGITIPNSVTSIGDEAFYYCTSLARVTIGNGVTSIGVSAFIRCDGLTNVTIPSSVTSIGDSAFVSCTSLTRAAFLGNAPSSMGQSVFTGCASDFMVTYLKGKTGFTSPLFYPAMAVNPAAPEIDIQQPVGGKLVDGTAKKSFGTAKVRRAGTSKIFTIKNTGTATLTGLAITKTGSHKGDFIVTTPFKSSVAPSTATTFKVTFMPHGVGTRNASIQIISNDANEHPFDIKLTGLGVTP
ncbi:MAG: leucine-rich repeat protein [Verrucomicrobiota bacterium]